MSSSKAKLRWMRSIASNDMRWRESDSIRWIHGEDSRFVVDTGENIALIIWVVWFSLRRHHCIATHAKGMKYTIWHTRCLNIRWAGVNYTLLMPFYVFVPKNYRHKNKRVLRTSMTSVNQRATSALDYHRPHKMKSTTSTNLANRPRRIAIDLVKWRALYN